MNILTDTLPEAFIIAGKRAPIKPDFKTWIRVGRVIADRGIDTPSAILEVLKLVFFFPPESLSEAIDEILKFYNPEFSVSGTNHKSRPIYDFSYDAELIYAAFIKDYGIDLQEKELHWWQFLALFNNLSEDTHFIKILGYRARKLSDIKSPEEKRFYKKMKRLYALPDRRTQAERERDTVNALEGAFQRIKKR